MFLQLAEEQGFPDGDGKVSSEQQKQAITPRSQIHYL